MVVPLIWRPVSTGATDGLLAFPNRGLSRWLAESSWSRKNMYPRNPQPHFISAIYSFSLGMAKLDLATGWHWPLTGDPGETRREC